MNSSTATVHDRESGCTPQLVEREVPKPAELLNGNGHKLVQVADLGRLGERSVEVPVSDLSFGFSPRARGHDQSHVEVLMGLLDRLPPILVHAPTMRVIDGVHRVIAARTKGRAQVRALLFHGSEAEASVQAIFCNVSHGKPLSLSERQKAAGSVLRVYPAWSDRRVAAVCGLSPKTVGRVRQDSSEEVPQLRLGRDGRSRPSDPTLSRRRIAELFRENPNATIQAVVAATASSPGTVRDVRARLQRGDSILPPRVAEAQSRQDEEPVDGAPAFEEKLKDDKAFNSRTTGMEFTEWLQSRLVADDGEWGEFVGSVPLSRVYEVADAARRCADSWRRFAAELEARTGGSYSKPQNPQP